MKHALSLALRFGVAVACLAYALWGVDFGKLLTALSLFRLPAVAAVAGGSLLVLVPAAWRLRFLLSRRVSTAAAYRGAILGLALNNVLPARLGEMGKAFYLKRQAGVSLGAALEAVFWERLFDLNALLVLGLIVAVWRGQTAVLYPLLGVVGSAWCFLALLRVYPSAAHALLRLVPVERARLLGGEILLLIEPRLAGGFLFRLAGITLLAWTGYTALFALALFWMAGLPPDLGLALTVFAVATLGFAVPGAPGGMGVYEAAFVLALGWFGVDKEQAFAVGLAVHMLQYLPVTAAGLSVMAGSGISLKSLRHAEGEAPAA